MALPFLKNSGLFWAKSTLEIHTHLGGGDMDTLVKALLDDLDSKQTKIAELEARIVVLEGQMPLALAS